MLVQFTDRYILPVSFMSNNNWRARVLTCYPSGYPGTIEENLDPKFIIGMIDPSGTLYMPSSSISFLAQSDLLSLEQQKPILLPQKSRKRTKEYVRRGRI
jgi:hypothetical protein